MKNSFNIFFLSFLFGSCLVFSQQENGVVSFDLPANNSLIFNKFIINPTFSFVKEDKSSIVLYNKQLFSAFDNPPQTYLLSFSSKLGENNAIAVAGFQQNYGLLSTTGAVINYARNVMFNDESNLTFGLNLSAYKSGLDVSKVITNTTDPLLNTIPSNTLVSISPGLNYGTGLFDFGIAAKNIVFYNGTTSKMLKDDPAKSIDGHIMYTGFLDSDGILEESKFSAIARAEMRKDITVLATTLMLNAPKAGWLQAGYNSLYGISGGAGFNIAKSFSLGVTYEKALGNVVDRGSALEFVLSYHFNKSDDEGSYNTSSPVIYTPTKVATSQPIVLPKTKEEIALQKQKDLELAKARIADQSAKAEAELIAKANKLAKDKEFAIQKAKDDAEKLKANNIAKATADEQNRIAKATAEKLRLAALTKAIVEKPSIIKTSDATQKAKETADAKAIADAEKARLAAEAKAKSDEAARIAKDLTTQKAKETADAKAIADSEKARLAADAKTKADEAARIAKDLTSQKAKETADAKAIADAEKLRLAVGEKAKADEAARIAKDLATQKARETADAKAIADAEKLRLATDAKAKADETARIAKDLAAQKAKETADAKVIADAEKARLVAEAKAKADEAARIAKDLATQKAKETADAKAIADAEKLRLAVGEKAKADEAARIAKDLATQKARETADAKAIADAEKARLAAEAKAKNDAAAKAKVDADAEKLRKDLEDAKIAATKSESDRSIDYLGGVIDDNNKTIAQSLKKFDSITKSKQKDLSDLKEENDTGIIKEDKPFQSASVAKKEAEILKAEIAESIKSQAEFINQFTGLVKERVGKTGNANETVNKEYLKSLANLQAEKIKLENFGESIQAKLDKINAEIEVEKKRRIKKANFESGQGRYEKDRASIKTIKESTPKSNANLKVDDFDFGDDENNMQILKNVDNTTTGYYMVIAVHKDIEKRDAFLTKVIAAGESNVDFFFNVNTGKYFIYIKKTTEIIEATKLLGQKESKPYYEKMSIIKIQN